MSVFREKKATQRLRHVNDLRRQGKRKVLAFQNVVRSRGASVECFVKVHVHVCSMSGKICDMLMPRLWWQKSPHVVVNPALSLLGSECSVF